MSVLCDGIPLVSPYAELIALRIEHDRPAAPVSLSILDFRGAESDKSLDLVIWILGSQVNMHSALGSLRFGNLPEQDPSDATVVGCSQSGEVILFGYGLVTGYL